MKDVKCRYTFDVTYEQTMGKRSNQEDAVRTSTDERRIYQKKGIMVVLSDGMGGMSQGEKFSEIATRGMITCFERTEPMESPRMELLRCFREAQKEALELVATGVSGGATVIAVLVRDDHCSFLCVGDSSLCLLRNGGLIHLNRMHTLGTTLDESVAFGYLEKEFADFNTQRNSLTSYLGAEEVTCDVCTEPFRIFPDDQIILMSDGVSGTLSDEELVEAISGGDVDSAAKRVIKEVLRKGDSRQDNASIALIRFVRNRR